MGHPTSERKAAWIFGAAGGMRGFFGCALKRSAQNDRHLGRPGVFLPQTAELSEIGAPGNDEIQGSFPFGKLRVRMTAFLRVAS
jgi:hypothetical protein